MDIDTRLLRYFLAIAREGNMTRAAKLLHVTQPTLSKQLNKLEDILDSKLFKRTSRQMILTEAGLRFRDRAREIIELTDKALHSMIQNKDSISGEVTIGAAESDAFRYLIKVFKTIHEAHPNIHYDVVSGNSLDSLERLDKGIFDFALVVGTPNIDQYHSLPLPTADTWGLIIRNDHPLSKYDHITPELLKDEPLIVSKQVFVNQELIEWLNNDWNEYNVVATFNLLNNAALMAEEGLGHVISLDKIIKTSDDSALCFRPFRPKIVAPLSLVWRKNASLSPAADKFLEVYRVGWK